MQIALVMQKHHKKLDKLKVINSKHLAKKQEQPSEAIRRKSYATKTQDQALHRMGRNAIENQASKNTTQTIRPPKPHGKKRRNANLADVHLNEPVRAHE